MTQKSVASTKLTPRVLAGHPDASVRKQAAKDLSDSKERPLAVLRLMQWDQDPDVRIAATPIPRLLTDTGVELAYMSDDPDPTVRGFLARVTRDQYSLSKLASDRDSAIRASVAQLCHSPELIASLARDQSEEVRYAVADNADCPDRLLSELGRDYSERVNSKAKEKLEYRERSLRDRLDNQDHYADWAKWSLAVQDLLQLRSRCQDETLLELGRTSARLGLGRIVRQSWMPQDALRELAGASKQYFAVLQAIATNPNTPSDVLAELSYVAAYNSLHSSDACDTACAALRNPNTPPETLRTFATGDGYYLGRVCTQEEEAAWSNPSIPETLILAKPTGRAAKGGIASNRFAPGFVLSKLAQDDDLHVRCDVAGNPSTPPDALLALSNNAVKDLSYGIAKPLAANPSTPREALLALQKHPELRVWLAQSRRTPSDILIQLASDSNASTRFAAAMNPSTPQSAAESLKEDQEVNELAYLNNVLWARQRALEDAYERNAEASPLQRPSTPSEAAATLIRALHVSDRSALATYAGPLFTAESEFLLNVLAGDPLPVVRSNVASNRHCTEVLRKQLAQDPDDEVRGAVAYHTASSEISASLVQDETVNRRLLDNLSTPPEALLLMLETAREHDIESQVAAHPSAPPSLLSKLASHTSPDTRKSVARHPKTDSQTLLHLCDDPDPLVRQLVAAHENALAEVLVSLAGDADPRVRAIVAMNRRTPTSTLSNLARDADPTIRQVVAFNPQVGVEDWEALAGDPDPRVRSAASQTLPASPDVRRRLAASLATHPELLHALASDVDASVRHAIALNQSTPPSALLSLSTDPAQKVRASVSKRTDAPIEALEGLIGDPSWGIRRAAKSVLRRRR